MAEENDSLSPEEKLLNVIQGAAEEGEAAEAKPVEVAQPPAEAAKAAPAAEAAPEGKKPALKVAAKNKTSGAAAPQETAKKDPAEEVAEPEAAASVEPALAFTKKKSGSGSGITLLNRMLAAGIVILLGLSGLETFLTIRARGAVQEPDALEVPRPEEVTLSVEEVKDAYSIDIWSHLDSVTAEDGTTTQTKTITVSTTPWQQTMKSHFKLAATSMKEPKAQSKAILVDSRNNNMYFVRLGESFMVEGTEVTLDDLESNRARFKVGGASIELK